MNSYRVGIIGKIKLLLFGKLYYQTKLLPFAVYKRYGIESYYSKDQISLSAKTIGFEKYYDEEIAAALLGSPTEFTEKAMYYKIREKHGLFGEGAQEVLRVYLGIEKYEGRVFPNGNPGETPLG